MSTKSSTATATTANHFQSSFVSASPSSAAGSSPTPSSPAICLVICATPQASKVLKEGPQKAAAAYQGSTLPDGKLSSNLIRHCGHAKNGGLQDDTKEEWELALKHLSEAAGLGTLHLY
ncbi:uncharacterized protein UBRO2_04808 [Ustilago bromivora]|uniref:Uncharacterized protein n=1 Tax=Ustilago bromivora TaxID=307758 RepID=A0A8H8QSW0_9BASI|nr:uncharacterized protein UBRO2_04808 [Ustilago bromivora]